MKTVRLVVSSECLGRQVLSDLNRTLGVREDSMEAMVYKAKLTITIIVGSYPSIMHKHLKCEYGVFPATLDFFNKWEDLYKRGMVDLCKGETLSCEVANVRKENQQIIDALLRSTLPPKEEEPKTPYVWIPVSKGLPKAGEEVLTYSKDTVYAESYFNIGVYDGRWYDTYDDEIDGVTHWMYIEPPKEVEHEDHHSFR